MVILHFTKDMSGKSDGVMKVIETILEHLSGNGLKQIVIHEGKTEVCNRLNKRNINHIEMPSLFAKIPIRAIYSLFKIILSSKIDIIHTHALKPMIIALIVNVLLRKKMIHHYHGFFIESEYYRNLEKKFYKIMVSFLLVFAPKVTVLVPHDACIRQLRAEYKKFSNIAVCLQPIHIKRREIVNTNLSHELIGYKQQGFFMIGFVGRLDPEKRFDRCLRIYEGINDKSKVKLIVMGDGTLEEKYRSQVKNAPNIHLLGYIESASSYLKYLDILLITSDREGLPAILFEAMESSLPIMSTNVGAICPIIRKYKTGYVFDRNEQQSAIEMLNLYISNAVSLRKHGDNWKAAIENFPTIEEYQQTMKSIYGL